MAKILLVGLGSAATVADLTSWLVRYGPVLDVHIVREGDASAPMAVVDMDASAIQASVIAYRISASRHGGAAVSAIPLPSSDL